jgi:hypothetical protein
MKTWGLPFPFLITHILRKKGIKGNATDMPITESPHFGCIQLNQSCSHMPRAAAALEPELSRREQLSQRGRQSMMSSQKKKKSMRR